jgi:hypothetical protein
VGLFFCGVRVLVIVFLPIAKTIKIADSGDAATNEKFGFFRHL